MSTVVLDTITGKSTATTITIGSTPVVSTSANSMTIRGEGSAQTSIQQGLCKVWVNFNGQGGNFATRDSFNMTSLTDNGTGDYTTTFANDFGNANYCFNGNSMYENSRSHVHSQSSNTAYATGSMRGISAFVSGTNGEDTADDGTIVNRAYFGDLA